MAVLPDCDRQTGLAIAERLRRAIADLQLPAPSKNSPYVTVSIGHASSQFLCGARPQALLAHADAALYRAKAGGRNRVEDQNGARLPMPSGSQTTTDSSEAMHSRVES